MKQPILMLLTMVTSLCYAQDAERCKDIEPTYMQRLPGFYIGDCRFSEYKEHEFVYWVNGEATTLKKAGVYREIWYRKNPDDTRHFSSEQILLNYNNAILKNKGKVLDNSKTTMTASINGKEVVLQIPTSNSSDVGSYQVFMVEVASMTQEIALNLGEAIDTDGKATLYGILFDTGKSDIKPESAESLKKIIDYLNANPTVKIIVVGHTDNVGAFTNNMTLSKSRAESITNYLITTGKISSSRLMSDGVGSLCPVSTNATEEGKKRNRRVEIVKQ
jgi:OOP family OmpA-OmpF porin